MKTLFNFFAFIITIPLFFIWLLFCAVIAIIGSLFTKKKIQINLKEVKEKETICSVLNKKGLISDEEYSFETNDVAKKYDETTFLGYLFILAPVIFLLKYTSFTDKLIVNIVYKWMDVHMYKKPMTYKANRFYTKLADICVYIASLVGQLIYRC